jgi:hypothetical protein
MSQVTVTVSVEKEVSDLMAQVVSVVKALKSGQSPAQIVLGELLKLQQMVADVQAIPGDLKDSLPATINAVTIGATDLAMAILGK